MFVLFLVVFINIYEYILKKKLICKIKICKEINGCIVVLLYWYI